MQVKQLPGLAISVNGAGISPALLGAAFPVDPGAFLVVAGAPGYLDWGMQIDISEKSERQTLAIPMLQRKASPAPAVNTPKRNVLPTVPVAAAVSTESRASDSSLLGLSLAGAGVVATGLGVYLGARSGAHEDSAAQYCLPSGYCNKRGLDFMAQARTAAGWSNSLYAVGGGLILGAGWVLWAGSPRPTTSPRQARVILRTNVLLGRAELLGVF